MKMDDAFFKTISLLTFSAILWFGFVVYNFFFPIKFFERDKISTEFIEIGNPFRDDNYYYQVKKYLFSKRWSIGFGGGSYYSKDYYGYGLADANKKIIVTPKRHTHYNFYKAIGYDKKEQLHIVNLIIVQSFKKSKKISSIYLNKDGTIFNAKEHFGENPVILIDITDNNLNFGCLFDLKLDICISNYYNMEWLNYKTLLVAKIDYVAKQNKIKYGTISSNGKLIIPITKISKEEVLQELKLKK